MGRSNKLTSLAAACVVAVLAACGQAADQTTGASTSVELTGPAASEPAPVTSGVASTLLEVPTTLESVVGDLTQPGAWIGHEFAHSTMFDPFAEVTLDGQPTGWIGGTEQCNFGQPPVTCLGFVRVDPGGYGHSETEPTTWMVLSWRSADGQQQRGIVFDSLSFETTSPSMWPVGNCTKVDGGAAVAVVQHDDAYQPTGDEEVDNAAHPPLAAWTIGDGLQLDEVPTEGVACRLYEYGD